QAIAIGDRLRFTPDFPGAPAYFVLFVVWFWLTAIARSPIADHPIADHPIADHPIARFRSVASPSASRECVTAIAAHRASSGPARETSARADTAPPLPRGSPDP